MKYLIHTLLLLLSLSFTLGAQTDRREVRAGNRKFKKEAFKEAEIDYRKAVVKDSLSVAGNYNLGSALYRQQDWEGAGKALEQVKDIAPSTENAARWHYNSGDVALQKKDYAAAVKAFREALLLTPDDLDAKENYIYAKPGSAGPEPRPAAARPESGQEPGSARPATAGAEDIAPAGPADAASHSGQGKRNPGQGEKGESRSA